MPDAAGGDKAVQELLSELAHHVEQLRGADAVDAMLAPRSQASRNEIGNAAAATIEELRRLAAHGDFALNRGPDPRQIASDAIDAFVEVIRSQKPAPGFKGEITIASVTRRSSGLTSLIKRRALAALESPVDERASATFEFRIRYDDQFDGLYSTNLEDARAKATERFTRRSPPSIVIERRLPASEWELVERVTQVAGDSSALSTRNETRHLAANADRRPVQRGAS